MKCKKCGEELQKKKVKVELEKVVANIYEAVVRCECGEVVNVTKTKATIKSR